MRIAASQVVKIIRNRNLGLFDYEVCRHAKRVNEDGTFQWLESEEGLPSYAVLFGMSKEEEKFCQARDGTLTGNDYLDIVKLPSSPNI